MHIRSWTPRTLIASAWQWLCLCGAVAFLAGSASALFWFGLEWATLTRQAHPWLVWGLPAVGFAVGWLYLKWGRSVDAGNNLLIDEVHDPQSVVPLRMVPLILGSTVASHLVGASVGREGTAVQMGGALADQVAHRFQWRAAQRQVVLMTGIAAGFASVFGTPLAGAVFALEVLAGPALRQMRWAALWPCVVAAVAADQVGLWWGVQHTVYNVDNVPAWSAWGLCAVLLAGGLMGLTGRVFALSTHGLSAWMKQRIAYAPLRPLIGGALIAVVVSVLPAERYLGLGIPVIVEAFAQPLAPWDFAAKMALTVASLGAGFKGGEVTPLFYIGATLGNALAPLLQMPVALMAAVGFVAVFAAAAKTPLACTVMALELFGVEVAAFAALACAVSYGFSGRASIYKAQRQRPAKTRWPWG